MVHYTSTYKSCPSCLGWNVFWSADWNWSRFNRQVYERLQVIAELGRVGQDRIYTPYMTISTVISLPRIPNIHRKLMILINPRNGWTDRSIELVSLVDFIKPCSYWYKMHVHVDAHTHTHTHSQLWGAVEDARTHTHARAYTHAHTHILTQGCSRGCTHARKHTHKHA